MTRNGSCYISRLLCANDLIGDHRERFLGIWLFFDRIHAALLALLSGDLGPHQGDTQHFAR